MSSIETLSVSSFMTRDVKTEKEDQNVLTACRIMHENNIGSVIIVKKDDKNNIKPVGIITERDVVRLLGSLNPSLLQTPLRDIMSKPLINVSINSSVRDAIQTMQQKNIRRLVISDGERMIGIITAKDLFRAIIYDQFGQDWFSDILQKP